MKKFIFSFLVLVLVIGCFIYFEITNAVAVTAALIIVPAVIVFIFLPSENPRQEKGSPE